MHTVTFHNIGNADCIRINLANGKKILFDYANCRNPYDKTDLRCDLPKELRDDLDERDYYDVVAFTHLDRDHYAGSTDFFYFEHITKYQDDVDGEPRIKMRTMWVPAAIITEALSRDASTVEAVAIQTEARARFKAGSGIRVFSRPGRLKDWCEENGVDLEKRKHLVTDAGLLAPEFSLDSDEVEFFVHSPFAVRQNANEVEDRNCDALVMDVTFESDGQRTKLFLGSDVTHEVLTDIVKVTEMKNRPERLEWDIFKLPHHCSYLTLSDEKGTDKTKPVPSVARVFEHYGQSKCIVVSSSDTIPRKGDERDTLVGANPPHRQAANYYRQDVIAPKNGQFVVTMEHPSTSKPTPMVVEIDFCKASVRQRVLTSVTSSAAAASYTAPRAG